MDRPVQQSRVPLATARAPARKPSAELDEAIQRLKADDRVDAASLAERVRRIRAQLEKGGSERGEDLGAELRSAAVLLLPLSGLESLRFDENPDIVLHISGEEVSFEVRRIRRSRGDESIEAAFEEARGTGRLAMYPVSMADAQERVAKEMILPKFENASPRHGQVLLLVCDSDHHYDEQLVGCAARQAAGEFLRKREDAPPYGAALAWQPGWSTPIDASLLNSGLLSRGAISALGSLPRLKWR